MERVAVQDGIFSDLQTADAVGNADDFSSRDERISSQ
jgi:hypothetical protein